jgi:hypothetical protein
MKIHDHHFVRCNARGFGVPKQRERGSATVVFIALLAIMMILVTAQSRALLHLRREAKFIEQQQIKRLNLSQTNVVTVNKPDSR